VRKDQSYVLYMLGQRELPRVMLPIGALTKHAVRARAAALGLRTAHKPESMDTCFVTRAGRGEFLRSRVTVPSGSVVATDGTVLGHHDGVTGFTVGQRRGLGVAVGERRYVVDVDAVAAKVTLGTRDDLARDEVVLRDLCFVGEWPPFSATLQAQVRAHGVPVEASLEGAAVRFAEAQPRV